MTVLEGLKPEKVFYFFEKLCEIPHGSTNMKESVIILFPLRKKEI